MTFPTPRPRKSLLVMAVATAMSTSGMVSAQTTSDLEARLAELEQRIIAAEQRAAAAERRADQAEQEVAQEQAAGASTDSRDIESRSPRWSDTPVVKKASPSTPMPVRGC